MKRKGPDHLRPGPLSASNTCQPALSPLTMGLASRLLRSFLENDFAPREHELVFPARLEDLVLVWDEDQAYVILVVSLNCHGMDIYLPFDGHLFSFEQVGMLINVADDLHYVPV